MESGNINGARRVLEEGSKLYPGDQFLLQRWGTLEAKHGDVTKARFLFEKSVTIQPHAPTFVAWAILEEEEGRVGPV
jgi:predicted Zn-dependent protease